MPKLAGLVHSWCNGLRRSWAIQRRKQALRKELREKIRSEMLKEPEWAPSTLFSQDLGYWAWCKRRFDREVNRRLDIRLANMKKAKHGATG